MEISEAATKAACDLVPSNQQKVCPYCGSSRIGIFDSDNDSCVDCKKWWSAGGHRVILLRDSGELKRKELRIQQACEEYARDLSDYKAKELAAKCAALELAIESAGLDVSPCRECGEPVVCVPDGLGTYCEKCAEKLGVQAAKDFMDEL